MVIVDTSAWIEFFKNGSTAVVEKVDRCLNRNAVAIGDIVYCEVMQGLRSERERKNVSALLLALPQVEMLGFAMAEKSARNYRLLRERGVTVRKTIDVMIGTFCAENYLAIVHYDRDFDLMSPHIGLKVF